MAKLKLSIGLFEYQITYHRDMLKMFGRKPPFCGLRIRVPGSIQIEGSYNLPLEEDQHATYGFLRAVLKLRVPFMEVVRSGVLLTAP
jgi:hypothetical protein